MADRPRGSLSPNSSTGASDPTGREDIYPISALRTELEAMSASLSKCQREKAALEAKVRAGSSAAPLYHMAAASPSDDPHVSDHCHSSMSANDGG